MAHVQNPIKKSVSNHFRASYTRAIVAIIRSHVRKADSSPHTDDTDSVDAQLALLHDILSVRTALKMQVQRERVAQARQSGGAAARPALDVSVSNEDGSDEEGAGVFGGADMAEAEQATTACYLSETQRSTICHALGIRSGRHSSAGAVRATQEQEGRNSAAAANVDGQAASTVSRKRQRRRQRPMRALMRGLSAVLGLRLPHGDASWRRTAVESMRSLAGCVRLSPPLHHPRRRVHQQRSPGIASASQSDHHRGKEAAAGATAGAEPDAGRAHLSAAPCTSTTDWQWCCPLHCSEEDLPAHAQLSGHLLNVGARPDMGLCRLKRHSDSASTSGHADDMMLGAREPAAQRAAQFQAGSTTG